MSVRASIPKTFTAHYNQGTSPACGETVTAGESQMAPGVHDDDRKPARPTRSRKKPDDEDSGDDGQEIRIGNVEVHLRGRGMIAPSGLLMLCYVSLSIVVLYLIWQIIRELVGK